MDKFKVGDMIEVSDGGAAWVKRRFLGMFSEWFMACNYMAGQPTAWQKARPIEPQYRTPTIADWGKECEFWDFNEEAFRKGILRGVIPELAYGFVNSSGCRHRNARIKVEE